MRILGKYTAISIFIISLPLANAKPLDSLNPTSLAQHVTLSSNLQLVKNNPAIKPTNNKQQANASKEIIGKDGSPDVAKEKENNEKIAPDIDLKDVTDAPIPVVKTNQDDEVEGQKTSDTSSQANTKGPTTANPAQKKDEQKTPESVPVIPLDLLGAKVLPNTSTRLAWSPGISLAGLALPTPVLVIHGAKTGPRLCLTAAVHGDELNGIEVVRRVMYDIEPKKLSGTIIGIPIVNLQGFQRGTRYLNDRRDLNRHFPGDATGSLAARVAHSLFDEVISQCDMLVDIHTGSFKRNNLAQIRADMSNPKVVKFTEGFGDIVVVHSPGKIGMLRYAAIVKNIKAVTMELGASMRLQKKQVDSGVKGVYSLLKKHKMYSKTFNWGQPAPIYYQSSWTRVTKGGILFSRVELGDNIRKEAILGTVTDPITNESVDITAKFDGKVIGIAENQVVMPGFAAYHIGVKSSEEDLMDNAQSQEPIPTP